MRKKIKAYAAAGVDVDLGNQVKSSLPALLRSTHTPGVISLPGGFGGLYSARFSDVPDPVLVSSMDGVGTKLKLAFQTGAHASVAADLVYHCVNDILTLGAKPLFFLDYMATAKLDPAVFRQVLTGLARACRATGCALIGGETAQMSDMYHPGEYDLAGTIVGLVSRRHILTGKDIRIGDAIIGLPSLGLHTNGYTLARNILLGKGKFALGDKLPGITTTVAAALLRPHRCYIKEYDALKKTKIPIRGMAHITGGGLPDNLPRILPAHLDAHINTASWKLPPLFRELVTRGKLERDEAYQTFNMGIGYVFIVPRADAQKAAKLLRGHIIGHITKGSKKVQLH